VAAHKRARILRRTAELLEAKAEGFAELIARESGKAWRYAANEVSRAVETFEFAAEEAKRLHGETVPLDASSSGEGRLGFYLRVPVGVVAAITPFNFPLNLVAHKVAPALAAGNTVVLKPADRTPLTAVALARTLADAGLPEGVLELVHGEGPTTGEALVRHPGPAKVSFTGSPSVGERILAIAGLKRVTLELGNNSGVMIEPDADLDAAIPRLVMSAFAYSGQVCLSLQRLFVHADVYDTVLERVVEETKALKVGDPRDRACDVGPMISEAAADRVESWVQAALDAGAKRPAGGRREAKLVWPTVLTQTRPEMKVMAEEIFGPVVSVVRYATFEEGLRRLADTPYGLQAGIYTRDLQKAFTAVRRLDMGGVLINDTPIYRADHMPYGGNKRSGIGREGVRFAIEEMTNLRMVVVNLT
jgi:acyl-CoA reductase-like NAD-dependent aldehyde dehydrogenase